MFRSNAELRKKIEQKVEQLERALEMDGEDASALALELAELTAGI